MCGRRATGAVTGGKENTYSTFAIVPNKRLLSLLHLHLGDGHAKEKRKETFTTITH
jgi:hypothetical protein